MASLLPAAVVVIGGTGAVRFAQAGRDEGNDVFGSRGSDRTKPFSVATGREVIVMLPDARPEDRAVRVIAPGSSVERRATRLMPHSRSRYSLLIELVLPLL